MWEKLSKVVARENHLKNILGLNLGEKSKILNENLYVKESNKIKEKVSGIFFE